MSHFQRVQVSGQICFWDMEHGLLKVPLFRTTVETEGKGEAPYNKKSVDFMASQICITNCILSLELLIARFVIWVSMWPPWACFHYEDRGSNP